MALSWQDHPWGNHLWDIAGTSRTGARRNVYLQYGKKKTHPPPSESLPGCTRWPASGTFWINVSMLLSALWCASKLLSKEGSSGWYFTHLAVKYFSLVFFLLMFDVLLAWIALFSCRFRSFTALFQYFWSEIAFLCFYGDKGFLFLNVIHLFFYFKKPLKNNLI